ncbi:MAG: GvpL/GvpF family gas vesicle protein [Alphaproteobacteria bacterium]
MTASGAGLYLYAFVAPGRDPALPPGLRGDVVRALRGDGVTALVSPVDGHLKACTEDLATHGAVCDAALGHGSLVPVRFGMILAHEEAVRDLMGRHSAVLRETLGRLEGLVELGLTVLDASGSGTEEREPETGLAYLRRLSGMQEDPDIADLHARAKALSADSRVRPGGPGPVLFKAAYLVARARVPALQQQVTDAPALARGWSVCLTGPWPAYHFIPDDLLAHARLGALIQ